MKARSSEVFANDWYYRALVRLTMVSALLAFPVHAQAPGTPGDGTNDKARQAQVFADQAYDAFQKQDWPKAVAMYLESFKLVPTPDVLFNVAVIYDRKMKDKAQAVEFYKRHNAASDTKPELVARATTRIAELSRVESANAPALATAPVAVATVNKPSEANGLLIAGIATGAAGVAGLGVGTGFGVLAISKMNQARALGCEKAGCPDKASADKSREAFFAGTTATVAFVAGGALAALGLTFILLAPKSNDPAQKAVTLQLNPVVGSAMTGLTVSGSF
jgi:tetratricopeptide (TPR) repeat protein